MTTARRYSKMDKLGPGLEVVNLDEKRFKLIQNRGNLSFLLMGETVRLFLNVNVYSLNSICQELKHFTRCKSAGISGSEDVHAGAESMKVVEIPN